MQYFLLFSLDERAIAAYQVGCDSIVPSRDFRQRLKVPPLKPFSIFSLRSLIRVVRHSVVSY